MTMINPKGINKEVYDSTCKKPGDKTSRRDGKIPKKSPQHAAEYSSTETSVNSHRFEVGNQEGCGG